MRVELLSAACRTSTSVMLATSFFRSRHPDLLGRGHLPTRWLKPSLLPRRCRTVCGAGINSSYVQVQFTSDDRLVSTPAVRTAKAGSHQEEHFRTP
jgi:hypothetical protein